MTTTIALQINGKPETITSPLNVTDFLRNRSIEPSHVALEINGVIVSKDEFDTYHINANDSIEIVRFVGGGK